MNQLRLDPLTGRWVVVSTDRATRPQAFAPRVAPIQADTSRPCPFCPGNEESATPALETRGADGKWLVRVVPNLYPAFEGNAPFVVTNRGPVFTQASAGGIHEVFVLSPSHQNSWSMLSDEQTTAVMTAIRDRIEEHSTIPGLRYSQAIVNAGREAGPPSSTPTASCSGCPSSPASWSRSRPDSPVSPAGACSCTTVDAEENVNHRVVYSDEQVLVICPFWSGAPYEMLVLPRAHGPHLHHSPHTDLVAVGKALKIALGSLRDVVGDISYNLVFHSAPYRAPEPYHWHVHVVPKLATVAGFELGTGVLINIVNPEEAAEELAVRAPVAQAG